MGNAANEVFDAGLDHEETKWWLHQACTRKTDKRECDWRFNDDALLECTACGEVTDI